jgi:hypothetical protein
MANLESNFIELPLFDDIDYEYTVALEAVAYRLRFYYNARNESWALDISFADGVPITLGNRVLPGYPMTIDDTKPYSGFLYLEPIGEEDNETISNPYEIWKYYRLIYAYE